MRLKIWHKMIIGITIPSLIALLGGMLTYGYINDANNRQQFVQIADDLREEVLEIRRNEKNYFHYKDDIHHQNLQNAISVFTGSINSISPEIIDEIGKEDFMRLREIILTYPSFINELIKDYEHENRITEEVRTEGRKLETIVEKGNHAKDLTLSFILHLRLLEKNYMLFRDKQSYLKLNNGVSQLRNITPFCYKCEPYIKVIHNLFSVYDKSGLMENNLRDIGREMERISGSIASRERQRIGAFMIKTKRLTLIVLMLLCTLGPLFVHKTAGYIVAPINRLAKITKKIAEGDRTLRAPIREHDETYSLATSFNIMLDQLYLTHQSLEKSMQLLHEKQNQLVESEKRASIGLLVSGVAHELNNPLNNISLTAETIMEDLEELNPEEMKDNIYDILVQSDRAHTIVENLLDFARARRSTDMEKLDIVSVVKESVTLIANQLRVNNINLNMDISDDVIYIKGNISKIEQIFVNITLNAIQAMKDEGTLTISLRPETDNDNVCLKISDTGPGIPEEAIKNIFEPFYTTKAVGEGTGLGLSVSHGLVMEHKGTIDVESKVGEGTTFIIKFPFYAIED